MSIPKDISLIYDNLFAALNRSMTGYKREQLGFLFAVGKLNPNRDYSILKNDEVKRYGDNPTAIQKTLVNKMGYDFALVIGPVMLSDSGQEYIAEHGRVPAEGEVSVAFSFLTRSHHYSAVCPVRIVDNYVVDIKKDNLVEDEYPDCV